MSARSTCSAHYPDAEEIRNDVADYYWEVGRFDREVGELLTRLEQMGELETRSS